MKQRLALALLATSTFAALAQQTESPPPITAPAPAPVTSPTVGTPSLSTSALPGEATQSPYYLGVQQSFTYESNIGFSPGGYDKLADIYSTTALRAGLNRPISRQRFSADAELRVNRFNKRSELNNTGYTVRAAWDWATIGRLSGLVAFNADQNRTRLATYLPVAAGSEIKNIERSEELRGVARLGGAGALTLEVGGDYRLVNFSNVQLADREYDRTGLHGAVIYRVSPATSLGTGLAVAKYDYRADAADRREAYLTAQWTPTALSDFQLRLGATKVDYNRLTAQNFSGVTGSLIWNWRPTGRSALAAYYTRDTGQDVGFIRLVPGQNVSAADFSRVTNTVGLRGTYEATSKILIDGGLSVQRREIGNLYAAGNTARREQSAVFSLGARWLPTRAVSLGCQISVEQRDTSHDLNTTTAFDTRANNEVFGCFGSFTVY